MSNTLGLLQEAQARANYHDDWERNFERPQERADIKEFRLRIKGAIARIVQVFRRQPHGVVERSAPDR